MALLDVSGLRAGYGKIDILHDVDVALDAGTLCAIVGANGAGKTTLLLALSAIVAKRAGTVRFNGADVTKRSTHDARPPRAACTSPKAAACSRI